MTRRKTAASRFIALGIVLLDELEGLAAFREAPFELLFFEPGQDVLEGRSRRKSHQNQIVACDERVRKNILICPFRTFPPDVIDGGKIFAGRQAIDARELDMIFKTVEPEKSLKARYRHLANSGKSGQIFDKGNYMMHLCP